MRETSRESIMEVGENPEKEEYKPVATRPLPVTIAVVLLALLSLANLLSPLMPSEGVPAFVNYLGVVLGVLGLLGAAGLLLLKRWGLWLTVVVCVLNILSAAPGLAFAPTPHATSPCNGWGRGLRRGHPVGGVAGPAPNVHLTNF